MLNYLLLPFEEVKLYSRLNHSLATLVLYRLGQQLHQPTWLDILVNVKKALFDDLLLPMLSDNFLVKGFFVWMLDYVLHSQQSLSVICDIFDILIKKGLNNMFCSLIAIMFDEVIDNQFIEIEQMPG